MTDCFTLKHVLETAQRQLADNANVMAMLATHPAEQARWKNLTHDEDGDNREAMQLCSLRLECLS